MSPYYLEGDGAVVVVERCVLPRARKWIRKRIRIRVGWKGYLLLQMSGYQTNDTVACIPLDAAAVSWIIREVQEARRLESLGFSVAALEFDEGYGEVIDIAPYRLLGDEDRTRFTSKRPAISDDNLLRGYFYRRVSAEGVSWRLSEKYTSADLWSAELGISELVRLTRSVQGGYS